jgi:Domain of unknown function (DUF6984)
VRALADNEVPLVRYLLAQAGIDADLESLQVEPMQDGEMGSLAFAPIADARKFGREAATCHFFDADGTLVSVSLNLDRGGRILEMDIWRVDYAPLRRWPTLDDIRPGGFPGRVRTH